MAIISLTPAAHAQDDLATVRQQAKTAAAKVADAQSNADKANGAYFAAESKLALLTVDVAAQETELADAQRAVGQLQNDLRDFLVDQYTSQTDAVTFFSMADINQALVQQSLTSVLANRKSTVIDDYRAAVSDLDVTAKKLTAQRNDQKKQLDYLASIKTRFMDDVARLATQKAALDAVLAKLEAAEAARIRAELAAKQAEARQRADEQARIRATNTTTRTTATRPGVIAGSVAGPPPPPASSPRVALTSCPVSGGASYSDTYGQPRSGGRSHVGVDMSAPIGTPVLAPVNGTVTFSSDALGGNTFVMTGADGNFYYGAHMSKQGPNSGPVKAGAVIGAVGQTGNASVAHLHLEIHLTGRGNPTNPYPSVARVC